MTAPTGHLGVLEGEACGGPAVIDEWLEHVDAHMCVAALNQWGTVLATGCLDGTILLWNMDTRGLARVHEPHNCIPTGCAEARTENIPDVAVDAPAAKVTALGWAHNGHAFATGSADGSFQLRDASTGNLLSYGTGPRTNEEAVTALVERPGEPGTWLISFAKGYPIIWRTDAKCAEITPLLMDMALAKPGEPTAATSTFAAVFSEDGARVYVTAERGMLCALDFVTGRVLARRRLPKFQGVVKGLCVSSDGKGLLVNSTDKILRAVRVEALMACVEPPRHHQATKMEIDATLSRPDAAAADAPPTALAALEETAILAGEDVREYLNAVERLQWRTACFSHNGDYVVAAAAIKAEHHIYIWSAHSQKLLKVLEGPKEGILDLVWHPFRAVAVSVGQTGVAYVWTKNALERWSAFAPDFKELVENEEYVEHENEFDICGEDDVNASDRKAVAMGFVTGEDDDLNAGTLNLAFGKGRVKQRLH
eukprot:CAMPEP_0119166026 /NCGR_PEP_ID=MMETSP1315-20130426/5571_1 /TAXON_ID=676789 /ORGANISM="Prasinoderma singularis, Strain RCC927" /LENGTH=480 /DNA_ID=CAMNT_0007159381 /DNA_START=497 /DNA_END=1940 /DNA_ORIENTATION=-